jgi:membrane associated rhomboid family serine protease
MRSATPVVKNIIIINVLFFLGSMAIPGLDQLLSGYYWSSSNFQPWQLVTHMFMHASIGHIFFNMYGLYLFGSALENYWGSKRFLTYYIVSGLGAFVLHNAMTYYELSQIIPQLSPSEWDMVRAEGAAAIQEGKNFIDPLMRKANSALNTGMVGASGAVFGILLAFGMLFPNTELMLLFPPIPLKAKWLVFGYGAIELYSAVQANPGDNVAHFAHLGGMISGYILLKYWQKNISDNHWR